MRLLRLSKWLAFGGAALWLVRQSNRPAGSAVRARASGLHIPAGLTPEYSADPNDPVQGLDEAVELRVTELDFDAMTRADAEAARDLAMLSSDLDERGGIDESELTALPSPRAQDVGELYGMHTPVAVDRDLPDGDTSFEVGENWIESLSASATEFGPEPEEDLDVSDSFDEPPLPLELRDIPVADRGSAGPRGV